MDSAVCSSCSISKILKKRLIEDHLVVLQNDKIHDSAYVELVNNKINVYYEEQHIVIDHYIEFDDECDFQFKSINTFWLFARKREHTDLVYFESSLRKGASGGVGGVIKSLTHYSLC